MKLSPVFPRDFNFSGYNSTTLKYLATFLRHGRIIGVNYVSRFEIFKSELLNYVALRIRRYCAIKIAATETCPIYMYFRIIAFTAKTEGNHRPFQPQNK